jgi:hypothetical protein
MVYHYDVGRGALSQNRSTTVRPRYANQITGRKMTAENAHVKPPSTYLLAIEGRAVLELGAFFWAYPFLRTAPRGDGHPVLVLPGLAANDVSTLALRTYLKDLGYAPHGWELGHNLGRHESVEGEMLDRLMELYDRYQCKVSVIGWSLGGVFARELAKEAPGAVRQVISLGSPIKGCAKSTNAWRVFELASGRRVGEGCHRGHPHHGTGDVPLRDCALLCQSRSRHVPEVPSTSIYSRTDGVVAWECSVQAESETTESIEIEGSHCGLGHNPVVLYAIADRLAQPEGQWVPFDRSGLRAFFYPDPKRSMAQAA